MNLKKLALTGVWAPGNSTHIESLYRPRYHGPHDKYTSAKTKIVKYRMFLNIVQFFYFRFGDGCEVLDSVSVIYGIMLVRFFHGLVRKLFIHIHFLIIDTSSEDTMWSNNPSFLGGGGTNAVLQRVLISPFSNLISCARNKITQIHCWISVIVLKVRYNNRDFMTTLVFKYLINYCLFIKSLSCPVSCHE
jgi:hypothetical protein